MIPLAVIDCGRLVEARHVPAVDAARAARRDLRPAGIRAQVDVQLAARRSAAGLLPDEALEVAAVARDGVDVVPLAAELARSSGSGSQPGAVHGRLDPVGELLPAGAVGAVGLRRRDGRGGRLLRARPSSLSRAARTAPRSRENVRSPLTGAMVARRLDVDGLVADQAARRRLPGRARRRCPPARARAPRHGSRRRPVRSRASRPGRPAAARARRRAGRRRRPSPAP